MQENRESQRFTPMHRAAAFAVHIFTATGAVLALLALLAASERAWTAMFAWLGCALFVDTIDGSIARRLRVRDAVPRWSGDLLDLVVDILTYVFVPAYALAVGGILPDSFSTLAAMLVVATSVLYFADTRMKSPDNYFIGFPGLWNLVAFYLFVLQLPSWIALAIVLTCCVLTFVPFPFVHPVRVARTHTVWISVALCLVGAWFVLAGVLRGRTGA